ncbi:MAG TPA: flagellar hook-associated protein FlgL [Nocardioides sp.]|nr:flagellar hook-associated protein FlgL [Nocardioides sp.]
MSLRVSHRSLFTTNVANLQQNLSRIQRTQGQLSSGRLLQAPSDDPGGAGAALRQRADIARSTQLARNATDGLGWLETADSSLDDVGSALQRVRELLVQANSTGTLSQAGAEAIADEIDALRDQLLSLANTQYLGRPIFGGATAGGEAYDPATGAFVGDTQPVSRAVRPGTAVQVNVTGPEVFGPPGADVFSYLEDVASHLRSDWSQLPSDLAAADAHLERALGARSVVGARYAQLETMRDRTDQDLLLLRERLSEIENIDLAATIVDLQLQETAYQAALSATAKSVQPSLLDFLR